MTRVRVSEAQAAALECRPLDPPFDDEGDALLARCWDRGAGVLVFAEHERDGLFSALNDASNGEDASADHTTDPTLRRLARAASRSLGALAGRVLRAGREV